MEAVYVERLLLLAAFLEALAPAKFDFGEWVGSGWKGAPELSCGTTACALGWACAIPEFRALGAVIRPGFNGPRLGIAGVEDSYPEDVSALLFGLDSADHRELFHPGRPPAYLDEYASSQEVAANIRRFVAERT